MSAPSSALERLTALFGSRLADTPPDPRLDRISRLAAEFFHTPMAAIIFVSRERVRFQSGCGLGAPELAELASFTVRTILGGDALVLPDAAADSRFADLPAVAGPPGIRFYAAVPLGGPDGFPLGAIAVMDTRPRVPLTPGELGSLRDFGALVEEGWSRGGLSGSADDWLPRFADDLPALVWWCDEEGRPTFQNRYWSEFSGRSLAAGTDLAWLELVHPEDRATVSAEMRGFLMRRTAAAIEFRLRRADGEYRRMLHHARLRFRQDRSFAGFIGVCMDITGCDGSDARLAAIVRSAEQAVLSIDQDARILTWNPAAERLFGYSAAEVQGHSILCIVPPDRTEEVAKAIERVKRGESIFRWETVRLHKNGTPIPVSLTVSAIKDPDGRPRAFSAIITDLTPLKELDAARIHTSEWLELAREAAGIGAWEWLPPEDTCTGSDQYFRLYGLPPRSSAMPFAEWLALVHPEDRERMRLFYDNIPRDARLLESEYRVVWPDGSVHWLVSKANVSQRNPIGESVRILGVNLDVTKLRQVEQARRDIEQRFRLLVEHGLDVLAVADSAGVIRYVSPSVMTVFGYQVESLIGTRGAELMHPDDRAAGREAAATILQAPLLSTSIRFRARHSDGAWRHVQGTLTNCLQIEGLHGIIVNLRDITPQKLFEEQLEDSRQQLRQLAAGIESAREQERLRVSREIHDELGQMLSALKLDIEGLAYQLRRRGLDPKNDLSKRIADLVRHTDISIDTVRRIAAELRPAILNDLGLCAALQWQIQEFAARTGVICRCRGLRQIVRLGPSTSLGVFRIFQEILTNVMRHAKARTVRVRVTIHRDWLILKVADDGKGLDPKHLADPNSLGLIGMRERAVLLGGSVDFSTGRGGGTVVTVRVPALASS